MAPTVNAAISPDPLRLPDKLGATPLKVGIDSEFLGMGSAVFDALVAHFGSVKALAFELEQADPSQIRAEIKAGDFRRIERVARQKPQIRAVVADAVDAACKPLRNADEDAAQCIAQVLVLLQRLAQYVAFRRVA